MGFETISADSEEEESIVVVAFVCRPSAFFCFVHFAISRFAFLYRAPVGVRVRHATGLLTVVRAASSEAKGMKHSSASIAIFRYKIPVLFSLCFPTQTCLLSSFLFS